MAATEPGYLAHCRELNSRLQNATDFMLPWTYFHDELAMSEAFRGAGSPAVNATLVQTLSVGATRALKKPLNATSPQMFHVPEGQIWHGFVALGALHGIFFYYDDINMGLLGVMRSLTDGGVDLVRFSVLTLSSVKGVAFPGDRGTA